MPTLVHNEDIGPEWANVEAKALSTLGIWLDTPKDVERYSRALPPHLRNYAGLQAKIAASALPWWRSNAAMWGFVRNAILPLIKLRVRTKIFFITASNVLEARLAGAARRRGVDREAPLARSARPRQDARPADDLIRPRCFRRQFR